MIFRQLLTIAPEAWETVPKMVAVEVETIKRRGHLAGQDEADGLH